MLESPPRFYGRRKGRPLRPTARQALDQVLDRLLFDPDDLAFISPNSPHDIWLEIGFGNGEHFLEQLQRNPQVRFLGCEAYTNGLATLCKALRTEDEQRVRLYPQDIRLGLPKIPSHTFSKVFVLFPDPWPKTPHHKRRLLQPGFLKELTRTLKPGAQIYFASDDVSYVEWAEALFKATSIFDLSYAFKSQTVASWPQRWPKTRYGDKALNKGKACFFRIYQIKEGQTGSL